MYETVVFLETSLTHREALKLFPEASYLPSIKKGDVLKAIKEGYKRIVIIDGNFSWIPSVWHKEILTALDYGLEVFGAASMGALRAAELNAFGMKGHGRIYEMYKNEEVDGDDEVAVAYSKYNGDQTIPLINLRVTLDKINIYEKERILDSLRFIFYAERTWDRIALAISEELYHLIKSNYVDAKKEDTKSLLLYLNQQQTPPITFNVDKKKRDFTLFEKKLIESTLSPVLLKDDGLAQNFELCQRAENIIKLLAIPKTKENMRYYQSLILLLDKQGYDMTEYEVVYQVEVFREERNLLKGQDFLHWLEDKDLCSLYLEQLFADYIKLTKYLVITYDYNQYFQLS